MPSGLILYGLIALAIAGAFGGTYFSGRQAGKAAERADWKPKLEACEGREKGLQGQIDAQNRAVEALAAESKAKQERAAQGLKAALAAAKAGQSEAVRLRAAAATVGERGACPAGEAVKAIREGLK